MQIVVAGLTDDAIKAVAHYYELLAEVSVTASSATGAH
jgi:cytochrome c553